MFGEYGLDTVKIQGKTVSGLKFSLFESEIGKFFEYSYFSSGSFSLGANIFTEGHSFIRRLIDQRSMLPIIGIELTKENGVISLGSPIENSLDGDFTSVIDIVDDTRGWKSSSKFLQVTFGESELKLTPAVIFFGLHVPYIGISNRIFVFIVNCA